ncbi:MAG: protein kinase [Anaerolineae bacterium]
MAQRDPFIGKSLGQYRIERVIGRGGMATVYEATQTTVNRTVAVKVLPQTLLHDETFMQRFRREAEVAAQLEHFHILPVYDYGETENVHYIVMRYIEGGALEDLIKREGALPWDDIVRIINQVASALDYAHGRGIVHRDIKPSNIMLDNDGNAYLADFGIARIVEGSGTLTGSAVIGTPKYMSPDQSNPGPPAPAMDIYSLGVTVFEMITGELPFNADTPIALVMMHLTQPVPSLREKGFDVPPAVDAVVNRAMAKNPEERFASAGAMAQALERAVRGEPWEADSGMTSPMGSPAQTLPGIDAVADPTVSRGAAPADPDSGVPGRRERRGSPVVFGLIGTVIVIALLAAGFFFLRGDGANGEAAALSATQTADAAAAIAAEEEPTETRLPTQTATATVQST